MNQTGRPVKKPEKKAGAASDLMDGLVLLSQFGMSIAISLGLCLWGAAWIRERFGLEKWVFVPAVFIGLWLSFSSFRNVSVYLQNRDAWKKKQQQDQLKKEARRREAGQVHKE